MTYKKYLSFVQQYLKRDPYAKNHRFSGDCLFGKNQLRNEIEKQ